MKETHERRIHGSFIQFQDVVADLLDATCDPVTVLRPHALQGLQHHQIEGPLQDVRLRGSVCASFGHTK